MHIDTHYLSDTQRVHLVLMEDSSHLKPDGDTYPPTVVDNLDWWRPETVATVSERYLQGVNLAGEDLTSIISRIKNDNPTRWEEVATRYFNIHYQSDLYITPAGGGKWAVALATPEWRKVVGHFWPLDRADIEDVLDWLNGDVYGIVHEEYIPACEHGHTGQWIDHDSVWGFYGDVNLAELAPHYYLVKEHP